MPFESSPRPITPSPVALRACPAAHSEARGLHEAESSRQLESSPGGNVASLAREAELATFLGRLGLAACLDGVLQSGCLDPEDVVSAPDEELQGVGLNRIQILRLRRHAGSFGVSCLGGDFFSTFLRSERISSESNLLQRGFWEKADFEHACEEELRAAGLLPAQVRRLQRKLSTGGGGSGGASAQGSGPGGGSAQGGGGSAGVVAQCSGPGGGAAQDGAGTGGASTSRAAPQAAAAAVPVVEHDQE